MFTADGRRPVLLAWQAELAQLAQARQKSDGGIADLPARCPSPATR